MSSDSSPIETFGSSFLADVQFNPDGTLKKTGKQNVRFYPKKRLSFRGKVLLNEDGTPQLDARGKQIPDIDPRTGLPHKEAFEETVTFVRVETKGDTNIKDQPADEFSKRQFFREYQHYYNGKIPDGVPLEEFDFLQPSTMMELHMLGIHVIEQAAVMTDLECEQLKEQPGYEVRAIAQQWVKINSPSGQSIKATRLEQENNELRRRLEAVTATHGRVGISREAMAIAASETPETPLATIELTPEELAKPRRERIKKSE